MGGWNRCCLAPLTMLAPRALDSSGTRRPCPQQGYDKHRHGSRSEPLVPLGASSSPLCASAAAAGVSTVESLDSCGRHAVLCCGADVPQPRRLGGRLQTSQTRLPDHGG
eukprot:4440031-Pyramimonas_sp.AAC.1